jgi:hypothetical protein
MSRYLVPKGKGTYQLLFSEVGARERKVNGPVQVRRPKVPPKARLSLYSVTNLILKYGILFLAL